MVSATLRAEDGVVLATVVLSDEDDGPVLVVSRVIRGNGNLLMYYFGGGGRAVRVEAGEATLDGTLATKWLGGKRLWLVRLAAPVTPGVLEPVESREEVAGSAVAARK